MKNDLRTLYLSSSWHMRCCLLRMQELQELKLAVKYVLYPLVVFCRLWNELGWPGLLRGLSISTIYCSLQFPSVNSRKCLDWIESFIKISIHGYLNHRHYTGCFVRCFLRSLFSCSGCVSVFGKTPPINLLFAINHYSLSNFFNSNWIFLIAAFLCKRTCSFFSPSKLPRWTPSKSNRRCKSISL